MVRVVDLPSSASAFFASALTLALIELRPGNGAWMQLTQALRCAIGQAQVRILSLTFP